MGAPSAVVLVVRRALATALGATLVAGLALVLSLTLLAPLAPPAPPAADAAGTVETALAPVAAAVPSATYRTFTLNVCHCLGPKKAMADVRKALTLGDAGGLQEFSQLEDRQNLMKLLNEKDWGWYMPTGLGVAIPIVWDRKRFRLIEGRSVMTHPAQNGVTPARFINTVRLRELGTGKVFGFINTHTIAQASRDAQLSNMNRIPRLRKHLRMLRQEIKRLATTTEHVFAAGDLNVNYLADRRRRLPGLPTDALGDLVSFDMALTGSRGQGSLLDYAMTLRKGSGFARTSATVVRGFNSDHDAVVITYRTNDLFATGALHNRPVGGSGADRKRIGDRQARAVMNAEPGDLVRLATARLDEPAVGDALVAAAAEGVRVQVVLGAGAGTDLERRLAAAVGSDRSAPSWVVRCSASCLGGAGRTDTSVLLVSRAGGTTELTMVGAGKVAKAARNQWSSSYVSSDPELYAGYGRIFARLAADTADTTRTRVLTWGRYVAQLYPVPDVPRRDPVLRGLAAVGCKNADGLRTSDGRTNVRVLVRSWAGARGKRIAERLVTLRRRGCDVAAVVGPQVLSGVRRTLQRGGVAVRTAKVGGNLLVVDGRYGKRAGVQKAWVGGPAWSDGALAGDGVSLVVSEPDTVRQYLDGFTRVWSNS
ncbi:endonuclease/exonuclease/phosphatase family protein [Nocardioides abyssi]|uniref:Endonuclease/exonuclease/phosphatase family protein n=1 Tax=Nocardioides abyssi TaxID=3058370 RepID=A0ABT8EVL9_9ACTN|nr:endonuclease/exonuclease/phosphatase family protein [Nocardioides abyssi]MDN4162167.1 endonuclease/exonuclease/phosphatase family protein [Nocardioides abyssi]